MTTLGTGKFFRGGFTVVELIIVIAVIAVLVAVVIVGYGSWRANAAKAAVKSDLTNILSAMEHQRNTNNGYPVMAAGTIFNGAGSTNFYTSSNGVTLTYYAGDATGYCINGVSAQSSTVRFFVDTRSSDKSVQEGECSAVVAGGGGGSGGGSGTPPAYNPAIPSKGYTLDQLQTICASSANAPAGYTVINAPGIGSVSGGAGHDIIYRPSAMGTTDGSGGNDILCIGSTTGSVSGGGGDDIIYVESGMGSIDGGAGDDAIISIGSHTGSVSGSAGSDVFIVRSNFGSVDGGAGTDALSSESTFTGGASSIESYF